MTLALAIIVASRSFLLAGAHVDAGATLTVGDDLDAETAASLVRQGCAQAAPDDDEAPSLADMTVVQLKGIAADKSIDLGSANKKAEILEVLEKAFTERASA